MANMTKNTNDWSVAPNRSNQPIQINTNGKYMDRNIVINAMPTATPNANIWTTVTSGTTILPFLTSGQSGYLADNVRISGLDMQKQTIDNLTFSVKMHNSRPCTTVINDGVNTWTFTRDSSGNIYVV